MLRDVGVFDPTSRLLRGHPTSRGEASSRWRVLCVPESVVHHLHGGSAGPEAQGFFFLNYRNWLVTVLRNGSPRQALHTLPLWPGV